MQLFFPEMHKTEVMWALPLNLAGQGTTFSPYFPTSLDFSSKIVASTAQLYQTKHLLCCSLTIWYYNGVTSQLNY
jgi:hypothetical protein